jgi:hypothetical protein
MVRDSVVDTTGVPRVMAEKTSKFGPSQPRPTGTEYNVRCILRAAILYFRKECILARMVKVHAGC